MVDAVQIVISCAILLLIIIIATIFIILNYQQKKKIEDRLNSIDKINTSTNDHLNLIDKTNTATNTRLSSIDNINTKTTTHLGEIDKTNTMTSDHLKTLDKIDKATKDNLTSIDKTTKEANTQIKTIQSNYVKKDDMNNSVDTLNLKAQNGDIKNLNTDKLSINSAWSINKLQSSSNYNMLGINFDNNNIVNMIKTDKSAFTRLNSGLHINSKYKNDTSALLLSADGANNVSLFTTKGASGLISSSNDPFNIYSDNIKVGNLKISNKSDANIDSTPDNLKIYGNSSSKNPRKLELGDNVDFTGNINVAKNSKVTGELNVGNNLQSDNNFTQTNNIRLSSKWTGFADNAKDKAEIANDTSAFKSLMIIGNKAAGTDRRVGVWDRLEVHGSLGVGGDIPNDWKGANFKRKDGRWSQLDWKDNGQNYLRGYTNIDDGLGVNGDVNVSKSVNAGARFGIKNKLNIETAGGPGWWNSITKTGDQVITNITENLNNSSLPKNGITIAPWNAVGGMRVHGGGVDINGAVNIQTLNVATKINSSNGISVTKNDPGPLIEKNYGADANRYGVGQWPKGATRLYTASAYPGTINLSLAKANNQFDDILSIKPDRTTDINGRLNVHSKLGVRSDGIETIDGADWMRIFGTSTNGTAMYNGVSINDGGGLNIGQWAKVPAGTLKVSGNTTIGGKVTSALLDVNGTTNTGSLNVNGTTNTGSLNVSGNTTFNGNLVNGNGLASIKSDGSIKSNKICINTTCINEADLIRILAKTAA